MYNNSKGQRKLPTKNSPVSFGCSRRSKDAVTEDGIAANAATI